jgi:hypothetical protein
MIAAGDTVKVLRAGAFGGARYRSTCEVQPSICLGNDCVAYPDLLTMKVTRPGITPVNVYPPSEPVVVLSP